MPLCSVQNVNLCHFMSGAIRLCAVCEMASFHVSCSTAVCSVWNVKWRHFMSGAIRLCVVCGM